MERRPTTSPGAPYRHIDRVSRRRKWLRRRIPGHTASTPSHIGWYRPIDPMTVGARQVPAAGHTRRPPHLAGPRRRPRTPAAGSPPDLRRTTAPATARQPEAWAAARRAPDPADALCSRLGHRPVRAGAVPRTARRRWRETATARSRRWGAFA